ncbi:MAG: hypothetical protein V3U80_08775 [Flavobacteriaceae bacterium]
MKKVILTLVIGLFFVAFSNAQTKKVATKAVETEVKAEYSVDEVSASEVMEATTKKAKGCCTGKKSATSKASCGSKNAEAKASCSGKKKASCGSKKTASKASCSGKSKASCGSKKA